MTIVKTARRMGLRDIYVANVTENTVNTYSAEIPKKLARSISAKITVKKNVSELRSDDTVEDLIENLEGIEVEIETNDLSPAEIALLQGATYENGYLIDNKDDTANPVALSFRAKRTDKKYEFVQLYVGKFNEGTTDNYETEEDKLKTQTAKLKGTFYPREKDGIYRIRVNESYLEENFTNAKTAIDDWFSKVQEPAPGIKTIVQ